MIGTKIYTPEDYEVLKTWWEARGMDYIPERFLSGFGVMVENVASGFIYKTDSCMAIIENFISNPNTPKEIRDQAIDQIIQLLLDYAATQGIESLVAFSDLPVIIERAKKFSFAVPEGSYKMMIRSV